MLGPFGTAEESGEKVLLPAGTWASGAKAQTWFQRLSGTSELVPFPLRGGVALFPQTVKPCPSTKPDSTTILSPPATLCRTRINGWLRLPARIPGFYAYPGLAPWAIFHRPSGAAPCRAMYCNPRRLFAHGARKDLTLFGDGGHSLEVQMARIMPSHNYIPRERNTFPEREAVYGSVIEAGLHL